MVTWAEFAKAARFGIGYALVSTVGGDGSPPLHPMTPLITEGRLLAFVAVHTVKYRNLLHDPRYALHAVLGESDEDVLVTGCATVSDDWASRMLAAAEAVRIGMTSRDDVLFEFYIERAHWAVWEGLGTPDISRRAKSWREG